MLCPVCGAYSVGQIGRRRYYCGECYHEWVETEGKFKVFRISSDGHLVRTGVLADKKPVPVFAAKTKEAL